MEMNKMNEMIDLTKMTPHELSMLLISKRNMELGRKFKKNKIYNIIFQEQKIKYFNLPIYRVERFANEKYKETLKQINQIDILNELDKRKNEKNKIKHCTHCKKNITESNWSRHLQTQKHLSFIEKEE